MKSLEPNRTAFHDAIMSLADLAIAIPPHRRVTLFTGIAQLA